MAEGRSQNAYFIIERQTRHMIDPYKLDFQKISTKLPHGVQNETFKIATPGREPEEPETPEKGPEIPETPPNGPENPCPEPPGPGKPIPSKPDLEEPETPNKGPGEPEEPCFLVT